VNNNTTTQVNNTTTTQLNNTTTTQINNTTTTQVSDYVSVPSGSSLPTASSSYVGTYYYLLGTHTGSASETEQDYSDNVSTASLSAFDASGNWNWQSFTPASTYALHDVKIYGYYTSAGNIQADLYDTSGNIPTGSSLDNGSVSTSGWASSSGSATWLDIIFNSSYTVNSGTKYAIVISATSGGAGDMSGDLANNYAGGNLGIASGSGESWTGYSNWDFAFECYSYSNPYTTDAMYVCIEDATNTYNWIEVKP
jgi:hypothetical protein